VRPDASTLAQAVVFLCVLALQLRSLRPAQDSVVDCRLAAEQIWVVQFPSAGFKFLLSKGFIFVSVVRGGQEIGVVGLGNFLVFFNGLKYERVPRKVIEGWIYSKVSQYFDEGCDSWKELNDDESNRIETRRLFYEIGVHDAVSAASSRWYTFCRQ
jgi:hypothetical protein